MQEVPNKLQLSEYTNVRVNVDLGSLAWLKGRETVAQDPCHHLATAAGGTVAESEGGRRPSVQESER
jgi:hypothetical protein